MQDHAKTLKTLKTVTLCLLALSLCVPVWGQTNTMKHAAAAGTLSADAKLHQDMRKLWTDHVVWTRDYIIAAAANTPDQKAASERLLKNQEDIGNAVGTYYGAAAGQKLTALLKEHIMIAVDLVAAAKAKDDARFQAADKKWQKNGDDIATFLSGANPNWPKATLAEMMKVHLSTTTDEVKARLGGKWEDDVRAFDAVYDHILKMADALSDGIVKQFPEKFSAKAT
jgi:hypothetical protein